MKISKKVVSLLLAATMMLSCVAIAIPFISLDSLAAEETITITDTVTNVDVTQKRVVGTDGSYETTYANYAANYLNGASNPTNIVIPGLDPTLDYVIQGMTYYPEKDWMLVTAYHNVADGETTQSSKVFALDAATGKFVAMFSFINEDGTINTDHGGGIAVSENNIYYSCGDKDRKIAYAPLSELDLEEEELGTHKQIQLVDSIDFVEIGSVNHDGKTAYSAYVCYDEGILWMGNFYDKGATVVIVSVAADYNAPSNEKYNSMVFGYELRGNSSAEEWAYLKGDFKNLATVSTASGTATSNGSTCTWNAYQNGNIISILGDITAPTSEVGEFTADFGSFSLTEGNKYTIEFTSTNNKTDMYMFAPNNGGHCNVKQSSQTTITKLEDGRYHYSMDFTAGLMPSGADSKWPTTQSTSGTYTGTYTLRFDQDNIAAGEARSFAISNIKISKKNDYSEESVYDEGYAGSPSYAIGLNNALNDVQYATVDNGKLYLSRSYGSGAGNSVTFGFGESSHLTVADIDLSVPGTVPVTISTTSTGSLDKTVMAYDISNYDDYAMMPMSEGLCVIDGEIFITFEGASNKYLNESSGLTAIGNCEKPVDIVWQLDPYELMEVEVAEPDKSMYYEKVESLSDIVDDEEYIIVHESAEENPVTQMPYLYAFDAFGNFKNHKLSKSSAEAVKGYDGMVGHAISYYSIVEDEASGKTRLYLDEPNVDDVENIRWTLKKISGTSDKYEIKSTAPYFANCNRFYFDADHITMAPSNASYLSAMQIDCLDESNGDFMFANGDKSLWCNDGGYNNKINSYYIQNSGTNPTFAGTSEQNGTFHCDAKNKSQNIVGGEVNSADSTFNIYKRVVDDVASTYESRVYTNLDASLQADGTYTVTLDTYAISPNHYQYVGERPTDYIFVADTTASMGENGSSGITPFTSDLELNSLCTTDNLKLDNGVGVSGYAFSLPEEEIYFLHSDGKYYRLYVAVNLVEYKNYYVYKECRQRYWVYYIADDGLYYVLQTSSCCGGTNGAVYAGITATEFRNRVDNSNSLGDSSYYTAYSTDTDKDNRAKTVVFSGGTHYRFDNINSTYANEHKRVDTMVNTAADLMSKVAAANGNNRLALVQFGGTNGYWNTSSVLSTSGADAFWTADKLGDLFACYNGTTATNFTNNSGTEMDYVNNIIANSGVDYTSTGDRNLAVVYISDGIPGQDGSTASTSTSATTAANNIISKANTAKSNGAFIYTVLIGNNEVSGFNKKTFMDAVSSKYAAATSMTSLGGQSVDGINYALNLADCTINTFINFGDVATKEIYANNAVGLDNLDANSYLREVLSDAFKFPENDEYSIETKFVPGVYDEIGRFAFEDAVDAKGITTNIDTATKTITVTGYDYSKFYISEGNPEGKALRVIITGLLADENADISNTSINKKEKTGLYKTAGKMNTDDAFRLLPTEYFNIPTYNYTLDFGMDMLDTDVNGTLLSTSYTLSKQKSYNKGNADDIVRIADGNENLIYSLDSNTTNNKQYVLIERPKNEDGTIEHDWFCIKLSPASNVYYEENKFETGKPGKVSWEDTGSSLVTYQSPIDPDTDIHGYDEGYAKGTNSYSNGTVKTVTITNNKKTSDTQTFTFTGTGFDLVSACGPTTGIMTVKVKDASGNLVKGYIVDTYNTSEFASGTTLYHQVPIVSYNNGTNIAETYTVEVNAVYLSSSNALNPQMASVTETEVADGIEATTAVAVKDNSKIYDELAALGMSDLINSDLEFVWFDDNSLLNGGTGANGTTDGIEMAAESVTHTPLTCYLDGFRIYHPLGTTNELYIDSEQNSNYINVINELAKDDGNVSGTFNSAFAFITGSLAEDETLSFSNYQSVGPQNEFYLKKGDANEALAFNITLPDASSKVHLGLRAVNGTATVKIGEKEFTINSATEMYYDVTSILTDSGTTGVKKITIQNTGSGILAVNNIKLTGGAATAAVSEEDLSTYALAMSAPSEEAFVVNGKVTTEKSEVEEPVEKTLFEKIIDFISYVFGKVFTIFSEIFVIFKKGGIF